MLCPTTHRPSLSARNAAAKKKEEKIARGFAVLCVLGLAMALIGCGDTSGLTDIEQASFAKGGIKGASTTVSSTEATQQEPVTTTDSLTYTLRHRADAPPLWTYEGSFIAVAGRRTIYDLFYSDGTWFMEVVIPQGAELLDANGQPVPKGQRVEITFQLDRELFQVTFGPHGSTFLGVQPAILKFSTQYAELAGMDPNGLSVWYQPYEGEPWTDLSTTWIEKSYWLETEIYHFSNYAVAW